VTKRIYHTTENHILKEVQINDIQIWTGVEAKHARGLYFSTKGQEGMYPDSRLNHELPSMRRGISVAHTDRLMVLTETIYNNFLKNTTK
jgi:hypothetical protein